MKPIPPVPEARIEALTPELLLRVIEADAYRTTVGDRYIHWDKLRRLEPPKGLTHEEWWLAIKMARRSQYRLLPIRANEGPFALAMPDALHRQLSESDRDLSGRVPIPEQVTNPATRDRYLMSSLMEESITSSQLEGAATSRRVASEMLRSGRRPHTEDERMIWNNFQAIQYVRTIAKEPLTPKLILEIHRKLTADLKDMTESSGRFRDRDDIFVMSPDGEILHVPPAAAQIEQRVAKFCEFANEQEGRGTYVHPIVRAVLLHFFIGYIHPFADGNGRTARALFYWSMLRSGYWLAEYLSISGILKKSPAEYARSYLYTETDGYDTTYFVLHQLTVLRRAIDELHAYVSEKAKEMQQTQALLRSSQAFNHRQLALLSHALKNPDGRYTATSHANSHMVTRQTARTDLKEIAALGLLETMKLGNGLVYLRPPDLEQRVHAMGRRGSDPKAR